MWIAKTNIAKQTSGERDLKIIKVESFIESLKINLLLRALHHDNMRSILLKYCYPDIMAFATYGKKNSKIKRKNEIK